MENSRFNSLLIYRLLFCLLLLIAPRTTDEMPPEQTVVLDEITISDTRPIRFDALEFLQQPFRDSVILFLKDCEVKGIDLLIVETYRTPERQDKLKKRGRSRLRGDQSKHQYGLAIDVVPIVNNRMVWYNRKLWLKIGKMGEKRGLRWGGRWRKFWDPGHFEYIETK